MNEQREFLEKLARYRELNAAERREVTRRLEDDPAAAELLGAYREMDERLARLPDPVPDPALARAFRSALARETAGDRGWSGWLRRAPAVAGQVAGVALLLLLVLAGALLFRDQLQMPAAGPGQTPTPAGEDTTPAALATQPAGPQPTGTPTPASFFPGPTPTPAVTIDVAAPFDPFAGYMAVWPEQTGMAHGSLRAGMKAFLQQVGGIEALADPAVMAGLENRLRPHVPVWGEQSLQLVDVYPGGGRELVVAVLPYVDIYAQDGNGILHVRGAGLPRYWPEADSWPQAVQVMTLPGSDATGIFITYGYGEVNDRAAELLVAAFDGTRAYWQEVWRGAVPELAALPEGVQPVEIDVGTGIPVLSLTCPAVGAFDRPAAGDNVDQRLARRDVYQWNGMRFEHVSIERAAPQTQRQFANVAEAYLRQGDFAEALARYRVLAAGESGLPAGTGEPDWQTLAALRAGQLHALQGETDAAREMLGRARLSSTQLGRVAGVFGETYDTSGDAVAAWAALLADGEMIRELVSQGNGLAGGAAEPLALFYPGMALAGALADLTPADLVQGSPPDVLARWNSRGLDVGPGRFADMDGDGSLEIVVAQMIPSPEEVSYVPVSLLDYGPQGWHAVSLGELPAANVAAGQFPGPEPGLPEPVPAPDGGYLLIEIGGIYAGWDGQQVQTFQAPRPGYPEWLRSNRPDHLCPLPAAEQMVPVTVPITGEGPTPAALEQEGLPTPPPTSTQFPGTALPPTPWDQDGMPQPSATPTPWDQDGMPQPNATPTPAG